jgi:hypothetical protein
VALQIEVKQISDELTTAINNTIRQIIEQDSSVTDRAIAQVTEEFIATKRAHFVTNKAVEDFRQLPILREAVIIAIKTMHKDQFETLEAPFLARLKAIQQKMSAIL